MDYQCIHDKIIERAFNKNIKGYFEKNHIIPKSLGGIDQSKNIVKLTPKEHYLIHRLLVILNPEHERLSYALWSMILKNKNTSERVNFSARIYEEARINMSIAIKKRL